MWQCHECTFKVNFIKWFLWSGKDFLNKIYFNKTCLWKCLMFMLVPLDGGKYTLYNTHTNFAKAEFLLTRFISPLTFMTVGVD